MASATQKPTSQNPESENPKKTLVHTLDDLSSKSQNPTRPNRPANSSNSALQEGEQSVSEDSNADFSKVDGNDSKAKENPAPTGTALISPTASSGSSADIQKKVRRAERFGVPVKLSEEEKRNSRAERFGMGSGSESSKTSEEQKRKARAERFGLPVQAQTDEEAKKKARLARFAPTSKIDDKEEEKRKAREARFSQTPSSTLHMNGKDSIEPVKNGDSSSPGH